MRNEREHARAREVEERHLLKTKLYVPENPYFLLARQRLYSRLSEALRFTQQVRLETGTHANTGRTDLHPQWIAFRLWGRDGHSTKGCLGRRRILLFMRFVQPIF